jgi:hypothetical protein
MSGSSPIKSKNFTENEDQNHADKDARLEHVGPNALVAHDSDAVARGETCQADGEATCQVHEAAVVASVLCVS